MKLATRWAFVATAIAVGISAGTIAQSAFGQHRHNERYRGDIRRFRERDWGVWRSGVWHHGVHDGRLGWWWIAGGLWYFYVAPVYPYPNPYVPYIPPATVVVPPGPDVSVPPAAQYWYYCDAARGYYPYVPSCAAGWRIVTPTPAGP